MQFAIDHHEKGTLICFPEVDFGLKPIFASSSNEDVPIVLLAPARKFDLLCSRKRRGDLYWRRAGQVWRGRVCSQGSRAHGIAGQALFGVLSILLLCKYIHLLGHISDSHAFNDGKVFSNKSLHLFLESQFISWASEDKWLRTNLTDTVIKRQFWMTNIKVPLTWHSPITSHNPGSSLASQLGQPAHQKLGQC